jgi:photosystem II stability/assembly factor-like uncharacterized protein
MIRTGMRTILATIVTALLGLGPVGRAAAAVDRWSTSGPGAADIFALAVSPSDHNIVYAGAAGYDFGSGMYKSTDGGRRWLPIDTGLGDRDVTTVAVSSSSSDIVYAGTYNRAVFATDDGGRHWTHKNWPSTYVTSIMAMAVDPSDSETVYASAQYTDEPYGAGLFKTTDGGRSWTDISYGVDYVYVYALAIDPTVPNTIFAGTGGRGVLKSTDGGTTWQHVNNGLGALPVSALVVDPQDPSTLYAGAEDYYHPQITGIYKSVDAGKSWTLLDMTEFGDFRHVLDIAIDPLSPTTVYASTQSSEDYAGGGVFKSTDGGQIWSAEPTGLFNRSVWRLSIDPASPSTVFAGTTAGVFRTTNGARTWSSASIGMLASLAEAVAVSPSAVYAGTASAGVFRSRDGVQWSPARDGMSGQDVVHGLAVDPLAPGTVYAATLGKGIYKTEDSGSTWASVHSGPTEVRTIAVDVVGRVYAGSDDGVYESTDGGDHWTLVLRPSPDFVVSAVATDPQLPDVAYAAAWYGGVYKSIDGGTDWVETDNGIVGAIQIAFAVDPMDSQVLYVGAYCYNTGETCVYKSADAGASWQPMDEGIPGTGVDAIAIDPTAHSTVYAGTVDLGVYRSTDGGASWQAFGVLPNKKVYSIAIDAAGTVYAATYGSGVFVYEFG